MSLFDQFYLTKICTYSIIIYQSANMNLLVQMKLKKNSKLKCTCRLINMKEKWEFLWSSDFRSLSNQQFILRHIWASVSATHLFSAIQKTQYLTNLYVIFYYILFFFSDRLILNNKLLGLEIDSLMPFYRMFHTASIPYVFRKIINFIAF